MFILFIDNWGDIATWFTGIVTFLALVFAFYQLHSDRKIVEEAEKMHQAEHISAWIEDEKGDNTRVALLNESKSPVYKVLVKVVRSGEDITTIIDQSLLGYVSFISVLPPGKYITYVEKGYRGMSFTPAIEISFTDAKGQHWIRGGNGKIKNIYQQPVEYYGLGEPLPWELPGERQFL